MFVFESTTAIRSAAESRVFGTEVQISVAATDNLTLNFAYGLADSKLKRFNDDEFTGLSGIDDPDLAMGGNVSGNESPRTPKHTANFSGIYENQLTANLDWFFRTDYTYEAKKWSTPMNLAHTGDRHLWNARIGIDGERWSVSTYVDNILDDQTVSEISDFPYFRLGSPTNPDTFWANAANPNLLVLTPQRGTNYGLSLQFRL